MLRERPKMTCDCLPGRTDQCPALHATRYQIENRHRVKTIIHICDSNYRVERYQKNLPSAVMLPCQLRMSSTGIPQIRFPISRMYLLSTELSHFIRAVMNSRAHFFAAFEVELRSVEKLETHATNNRHQQALPAWV